MTRHETELASGLAGVLFPCAWLGKVGVVVFYIGIGGPVAKLAGHGWLRAGCRARRFFFDDTFVFVAIVTFGHCSIEMMRKLSSVVFAGTVSGGTLSVLE